MGMSAGQARLLSITARLTDNELRSQTITNSKLRLADKSTEASEEYMNSLNSEKLVYNFFNDNGVTSSYSLTPALLYSYDVLKNQYSLQTSSGVNLVSSKDAANYEKTNSLYEFLACYMDVDSSGYDKYQAEMDKYKLEKAKYDLEKAKYDKDYVKYLADYEAWFASQSGPDLYAIFSGAVGTSDIKDGPFPTEKSQQCYWSALQASDANECSCFSHILGHIIDYRKDLDTCGNNGNNGTYSTTTGDKFKISGDPSGYMDDACNSEMEQVSNGLNEKDADGNYIRFCDGTDDYQGINGINNKLEQAKADYQAGKITETEYKLQRLLSDFVDNGNDTYSVKSLKQKAVDLMYIVKNWGPALNSAKPAETGEFPESMLSRNDMIDALINFTDGDMKKLTLPKPVEPEKPIPPIKPEKPMYLLTVEDKDKAQWYTNLWYMMNGSDSVNLVRKINSDNKADNSKEAAANNNTDAANFQYSVTTVEKNLSKSNYKVIDENLMNNSEWLQFALENGIVTLKQAQYHTPSLNDFKAQELTSDGIMWTSVIYSSAPDIAAQENEAAIAAAEVKYKKTVTEIENQDKKFDQDLRKLDTEHNALQTEYESLKSTIDKNVERSFKAFS